MTSSIVRAGLTAAFVLCATMGPAPSLAQAPDPSTSVKGDAVHKHTNQLIHETSPYLLQHAHNPVNWLPWGPEAFEKAKAENKPIFVSVGYSTCYWCHVMERQSFEKEDVAKILNDFYICVKVDREERPEVDQQYMMATQLVTGRGGWPNSVWLTPDGRPWMAGTYFPRDQFKLALLQMADVWEKRQSDVDKQATLITNAVERTGLTAMPPKAITQELIDASIKASTARFDAAHGGFGEKPKFPPHDALALLADQYRRNGSPEVLKILDKTLSGMARGGVYDQIGGGFHRYSTDERWLLPHFEKMLYDNGQLIKAYTDGYLLTSDGDHRATVEGIYQWLRREMTSPQGAFYSAIDSESDAEEGKFYVWSNEEVVDVLGESDAKAFSDAYGVLAEGNFREEATGEQSENNVLHRTSDTPVDDERLTAMRERLLEVRSRREYPHLDDKVIASWNGLMIEGLAYAGRQLDEPKYTAAAAAAADFILTEMVRDGKLQRTHRDGRAKLDGYLNDYAFVAAGLVELHKATDDDRYLDEAERLVAVALTQFQDREDGGFFFTAKPQAESKEFVIRSKNLAGGGNLPSGNGVMARVLVELASITGKTEYQDAAQRTLEGLSGFLWQAAGQPDALVLAAAEWLGRGEGEPDRRTFRASGVTGRVVAPKSVKPGQTFVAAVELSIEDGWHLYGESDVDFVKPTVVKYNEGNVLKLAKLTAPDPIEKQDEVFGKTLKTYEGEVSFTLELNVPKDIDPGPQTVKLSVETQACDAKQCAAPAKSELEFAVHVRDPTNPTDSSD